MRHVFTTDLKQQQKKTNPKTKTNKKNHTPQPKSKELVFKTAANLFWLKIQPRYKLTAVLYLVKKPNPHLCCTHYSLLELENTGLNIKTTIEKTYLLLCTTTTLGKNKKTLKRYSEKQK